jgi:hypothetical protein
MVNITLKTWFSNTVDYLHSIGLVITPSSPDEFVAKHLNVTVGPLDAFHVAVRVKVKNITITDSSGTVMYSGDLPPGKDQYIYSVVSIAGFEDPFIVRELNGLYTRVITPCRIPFTGGTYGYYNSTREEDIDELTLNWCYIGIPDNPSAGMYYPTILDRFEGSMKNHDYYVSLSRQFQRDLGYAVELPAGLETFMIQDETVDPTLLGALDSVGAGIPAPYSNVTSVSYYFLKCMVDKNGNYCKESTWKYHAFQLDATTKKRVFGQ